MCILLRKPHKDMKECFSISPLVGKMLVCVWGVCVCNLVHKITELKIFQNSLLSHLWGLSSKC